MAHGAIDWLVAPEFKIREQYLFEQFAYSGYSNTGGSAGLVPFMKLHNPADSGVICRPYRIGYSSQYASTMKAGISNIVGSDVSDNIGNLYLGGPAGSCYFKGGSSGLLTLYELYTQKALADTWDKFDDVDVIIPPGYHLTVVSLAVSASLQVTMKWLEIPI